MNVMNELKKFRKLLVVGVFLIFINQLPFAGLNDYSQSTGNNYTSHSFSGGRTLYVGGDGPNNYSRIRDAINNASDGDTIVIFYNIYHENITLDKELHIIGIEKNGEKPIIYERKGDFAISIMANNCTLRNLRLIMNASVTLKISSSFNLIENCYITNPPERGLCGHAIMMTYSNHNRIINNTIESKGGAGVSLRMYGCHGNNFSYNTITGDWCDYDSLWIIESSNNSFYHNIIRGMECMYSDENIFYNNTFTLTARTYASKNNLFKNNNLRSLKLYNSVNFRIRNNIFDGPLDLNGDKLKYYNTHIIENNTKYLKNGPKILYYKNSPDIIISEKNVAEIIVANCSNSIIRDVKIKNSSIPLLIMYSNNTLVYDCSISYTRDDVGYGIIIGFSTGCVIRNNHISKIKEGILVFDSINTKIVNNDIENTMGGIVVAHSSYTKIQRNKIYESLYGIYLYKNLYTLIRRNHIKDNFDGVKLKNTFLNIIKRNNFIGNDKSVLLWESFINILFRNHWSEWILPLPKPVLCILLSIPWVIIIPYIIFDFFPRLIPYLII